MRNYVLKELISRMNNLAMILMPWQTSTPIEKRPLEPEPYFVIEPTQGWAVLQLDRLWQYRDLLYFLVWRDIKVRYKQTAIGAIWAVLQPVLLMLVFSFFFGQLFQIPSEGVPYYIFTYIALMVWQFFANSIALASNSLVSNRELITKIYFPRLIVPLSSIFVGLIDLALALIVLLAILLYSNILPTLAILTAPFFILLGIIMAIAVGVWLAAINVQYRDVQNIIPFLLQVWMFATPIFYPGTIVPEPWRLIYNLNPMVGLIDGFRWSLLGSAKWPLDQTALLVSMAVTSVILISGAFYFRRIEKTFADVI